MTDGESPARWLLGAIIGLPAMLAVLMLSGGDVLVAHGRAAQAARLPGNSVLPAGAIIPALQYGEKGEWAEALALEALRVSPLAGDALTWLALGGARQGDADKSLLAIAGQTGWHDEWTQRNLYNATLRAGDPERALRHADALLRQGHARGELFAQFVQGMGVPKFRAAFVAVAATSPHWLRDFLVQRGGELGDPALLNVVKAQAKARGGLDRQLAASLLAMLVSDGRTETAAQLWALVPGTSPNVLAWPDALAANTPTAFDWNLPAGYTIEGDEEALVVEAGTPPGAFARRLVVLPPGDYRLIAPAAEGWLWGAGCANGAVVPNRRLSAVASFSVTTGCPATALVLSSANTGQAEPLGELSLERLQ